MDDAMVTSEMGSLLTVEFLMRAYGTLGLSRGQARQRLLVNTDQDADTAAWFDLRWPLREGE